MKKKNRFHFPGHPLDEQFAPEAQEQHAAMTAAIGADDGAEVGRLLDAGSSPYAEVSVMVGEGADRPTGTLGFIDAMRRGKLGAAKAFLDRSDSWAATCWLENDRSSQAEVMTVGFALAFHCAVGLAGPKLVQPFASERFESHDATPVLVALFHGWLQPDAVDYLLGVGWDPAATCAKGRTALMGAAGAHNLHAVQKLLPLVDAKAADAEGATALMRFVEYWPDARGLPGAWLDEEVDGALELWAILAPASDPLAVDKRGRNALMRAASAGHAEHVARLAGFGGGEARDEGGWTALRHAVESGSMACVEALLSPEAVGGKAEANRMVAAAKKAGRPEMASLLKGFCAALLEAAEVRRGVKASKGAAGPRPRL